MRTRSISLIIGISLGLALSTVAAAQLAELKNTTPEMRSTLLTDIMKTKLGLTGATLEKVSDINLKYAKKMQPIVDGSEGGLFREMRDIKAVNQEKEAELKSVLSPDQFQQYLAAKDEMRQQFEQRIKDSKNAPQ